MFMYRISSKPHPLCTRPIPHYSNYPKNVTLYYLHSHGINLTRHGNSLSLVLGPKVSFRHQRQKHTQLEVSCETIFLAV